MKRYMVLAILAALGLAGVVLLVADGMTEGFDGSVAAFVQSARSDLLTQAAEALAVIGDMAGMVVISLLVTLLLFFRLRLRAETALFAAVMIGSTVLNKLLKLIFERERPVLNRLVEEEGFSFPSGHMMGGVAFFGVMLFLLWAMVPSRMGRLWLAVAAVFLMAVTGLARIYLGVHYPSDVAASVFASGFWLFLMIGTYTQYQAAKARTAHERDPTLGS